MEIVAASPYCRRHLPNLSRQQEKAINSPTSSMSRGFHHGIFGFPSEGIGRQPQPEHHPQDQETAIYDPGANMLSEMFNFAPSGFPAAADLLANQLPPGYGRLHRPPAQPPPAAPGFGGDVTWYGGAVHRDDSSGAENVSKHNHHHANIQALNADSAAAMQLFLMNPPQQQTRSPSTPPCPYIPHAIPLHHDFVPATSFVGGVEAEGRGLSLSLNSDPLQQLELAKAEEHRKRDGLMFYSSGHGNIPLQLQGVRQQRQNEGQPILNGGFGAPTQMVNVLRHSKYARPAMELVQEFCNVGGGQLKGCGGASRGKRQTSLSNPNMSPSPAQKGDVGGDGVDAAASSSKDFSPPVLYPSDRFEQQTRKAKLRSMLDEVDRRYGHYREEMQMVVNSFDAVMGLGSATPYTGLAQTAMSRHFRCLKDAIALQLRHTCELLGEKDGGAAGITKGETPRLRVLDQSLRQQRSSSFHQMGIMDQETWRPQRGLPERSVNILRSWLFEHFLHPYPSDADKQLLARQSGLSRNQVSNWFINARVRLWKPMIENMYLEEAKVEEQNQKGGEQSQSSQQQAQGTHNPETSTSTGRTAEGKTTASQITPLPTPSNLPMKARQQLSPFPSLSSSEGNLNPLGTGMEDRLAAAAAFNVGAGRGIIRDGQMAGAYAGAHFGFGAPGDQVSLTLGLRHAGNVPEDGSSAGFSPGDFAGR